MAVGKYFGPSQELHIFRKRRFDTFLNNNYDVTKVKKSPNSLKFILSEKKIIKDSNFNFD